VDPPDPGRAGRGPVVSAGHPRNVGPPDIHLDTSFLIRALVRGSAASTRLREWIQNGRTIAMSTLAWGEFLCGPLSDEAEATAHRLVRVHVALGTQEAAAAAQLFNESGRRRGSFPDCLIAATSMAEGAELATEDREDFARLTGWGLALAR